MYIHFRCNYYMIISLCFSIYARRLFRWVPRESLVSNFTNFTPTAFYRHSFSAMTSLGEHFQGGKMGGKSRLELPKLGDAQQHSLETIYPPLRSQRHTYQQRISASCMCILLSINVKPAFTCPPQWTERPWCFMRVIADIPSPQVEVILCVV